MPLRHITAHHHQSPPYHYGTIAVARVDGTRTSIERRTVTLPSTASEPAGSGSGQPDLTVTITRHDTLATVAPLWREFQERALGHPFQRYEFVSAWLEHVGAGSVAPFICVAETSPGDTVLLLPLGVEAGRFTRRLVWLAQDVSDYTAPLIEAGFAERLDQTALMTLWPNVLALAPPVDYLHLAKQVETIGDAANPFFALNSQPHTCSAYSAELVAPWEDYHAGKRSAKSRRRLREKEKRLARHGEVRLVFHTDVCERVRIIEDILRLKSAQLDEIGGRNIFSRPDVQRFFAALVADPAAIPATPVFTLYAGDTPAAAGFGLIHARRFYYVIPTYRPDVFHNCSAGAILLNRLLEWSIDQGFTTFDFTLGDEAYKFDWADTELAIGHALVPLTIKGRMAAAARTGWIELKRRVRADARLAGPARGLIRISRRMVGSLSASRIGPDPSGGRGRDDG